MAAAGVEGISNGVETMSVNNESNPANSPEKQCVDEWMEKWHFPLQDVYKIALKFFKEKEGKAIQLTYKTKLHLVALTKQAAFGKFRPDVSPDVGFLDVVGNDRRQAWQALGEMTSEAAMAEFVKKVAESCTLFEPYVEAHKAEREEAEKKRKEEEAQKLQEAEESQKAELAKQMLEAEKQKQQEQELQIRAALNQQTQVQFRQYAEQQYPNNTTLQDELIKQLQDQHFQQYMQQVYHQQLLQQQQQQQLQQQQQQESTPNTTTTTTPTANGEMVPSESVNNNSSPVPEGVTPVSTGGEDEEDYPLAAASMWTRKDIKDFKESLVKDKESVIKIGSGETVTVRVPTHEDGTCLFWEFATDYYDIGFGVYFEWTQSATNTISVHVSESSDEEDEEEENKAEGEGKGGDVEKGSSASKKEENRPPTDEIIPVYRRDCHEEVYCGSHTYPGQGVYLLKFDNSYSLWRSKTLYYRVYYSR